MKDLIHWAHIIDGALYESPAQCVELKEPALQLMQVIESVPDESFIEHIIRELTRKALERGRHQRRSRSQISADPRSSIVRRSKLIKRESSLC